MSYSYLNNINLKQNTSSKWYGGLNLYRENLLYDVRIKEALFKSTYFFKGFTITNHTVEISDVKNKKLIILVIMYTKYNKKLNHDKIKSIVESHLRKQIVLEDYVSLNIDFIYDSKPFTSAFYIAQNIASNMIFRVNCRRLSLIAQKAIQAGVLGCIIEIKGRINGHDISRKDRVIRGKVGRNTLVNNVDFKRYTFVGRSGCVGIRVWINKGKLKNIKNINKN